MLFPRSQTQWVWVWVGLEEVRVETSAFISSDVQPGLGNTELSIWAAVSGKAFYFLKF